MSKKFLLISTPIMIAAGGLLRDFKTVPHIVSMLRSEGYEVYLYFPYNTLEFIAKSYCRTNEDCEVIHRKLEEGIKLVRASGAIIDEDLTCSMLEEAIAKAQQARSSMINRILDFGYLYVLARATKESMYIKKFVSRVADDFIASYQTGEGVYTLYGLWTISKEQRKPIKLVALLQLEPYSWSSLKPRFSRFSKVTVSIANTQLHRATRSIWIKAMRDGILRGILSVSPAPLIISEIHEEARKYGVKIGIPLPANAFDKEIIKFRRKDRDNVAVFFGRLTRRKGVLELLEAWSKIRQGIPDAKLIIIGSLSHSDKDRRLFISKLKRTPNAEYLGFIDDRDRLFKTVSKAKLLIYPSHEDAFPLTVLEALALGLAVVAYDIPAIKFVYRDLKPVYLVREGDITTLARKSIEILKRDPEEIEGLFEDDNVKHFLELHSSWSNVAKAEYSLLKKLLRLD